MQTSFSVVIDAQKKSTCCRLEISMQKAGALSMPLCILLCPSCSFSVTDYKI